MGAGDGRRGWKVRDRGDGEGGGWRVEGGGEGKGLRAAGALRSGMSRSLPCERALRGGERAVAGW
jgi:hypothetical protein